MNNNGYKPLLRYNGTEAEAVDLTSSQNTITTPHNLDIHDHQTENNKDTTSKKLKYGPEEVRRFIEILQEEGVSVPVAAKRCNIPRSTAYNLFNEFNAGDGTVLPGGFSKKKANRGTMKKILPEHTRFLVSYFDQHPQSTLEKAREALVTNFEGFTISLPALWRHTTEQCIFNHKQGAKGNVEKETE